MRTEQEMINLILDVAKADERIRAVLMVGSRANPTITKDSYQDYDIAYFVTDMKPFYYRQEEEDGMREYLRIVKEYVL